MTIVTGMPQTYRGFHHFFEQAHPTYLPGLRSVERRFLTIERRGF
jgi:hypothetical protein